MSRRQARPSKYVHQMMRPVMAQKIASEAQSVREFVSENLLLARMCMESGHISDRALGSLITGLRIVHTVADALKDERVCRIIDGANTPAVQIVDRFKDGVTQAQRMELAAISAAISVSLEALDDMPDAALVLAYELSRAHRMQAKAMRAKAEAA